MVVAALAGLVPGLLSGENPLDLVKNLPLVGSLLGNLGASKSNANVDRTLGRFYRAGAPVSVGAVMCRIASTGADQWAQAVQLLGIATAPESGQTKNGYANDPPVRRRDESQLLAWQAAAKSGDVNRRDLEIPGLGGYDWGKLLLAWGATPAPDPRVERAASEQLARNAPELALSGQGPQLAPPAAPVPAVPAKPADTTMLLVGAIAGVGALLALGSAGRN